MIEKGLPAAHRAMEETDNEKDLQETTDKQKHGASLWMYMRLWVLLLYMYNWQQNSILSSIEHSIQFELCLYRSPQQQIRNTLTTQ